MAPLGCQPGVVEIEPANHGADVESRLHRVKLITRARHACAVGNHRSRHDGPEELGARRIFECLQSAAEGVDQAMLSGAVSKLAVDLVIEDIAGDVREDLVRRGTLIADVRRQSFLSETWVRVRTTSVRRWERSSSYLARYSSPKAE
jgi:hypothetical protein